MPEQKVAAMKNVFTWTMVLVLGLSALIAYPSLAEAGDGAPIAAAKLLVPFGFLAAMTGAIGLFMTWCLQQGASAD